MPGQIEAGTEIHIPPSDVTLVGRLKVGVVMCKAVKQFVHKSNKEHNLMLANADGNIRFPIYKHSAM